MPGAQAKFAAAPPPSAQPFTARAKCSAHIRDLQWDDANICRLADTLAPEPDVFERYRHAPNHNFERDGIPRPWHWQGAKVWLSCLAGPTVQGQARALTYSAGLGASVSPPLLRASGALLASIQSQGPGATGSAISALRLQFLLASPTCSLFSTLATLACVTAAMLACFGPQSGEQGCTAATKMPWELAQGLALSPWVPLAKLGLLAGAGPAVIFTVLLMFSAGALVEANRGSDMPSRLTMQLASSCIFASAPTLASVYLGLSGGQAFMRSATSLSTALLICCLTAWYQQLRTLPHQAPVVVNAKVVAMPHTTRFDVPGERKPSVFIDHPGFGALIQSLVANLRAGRPMAGQALLVGPPGCGKSEAIRAMQNLPSGRGITLVCIHPEDIFGADAPDAAVAGLFRELRSMARRSPQHSFVLVFDEGELAFPAPRQQADQRRAAALSDAFKNALDGIDPKANENIFVIVSVNNDEGFDPAIKSRFQSHTYLFELSPPATVKKVIRTAFAQRHSDHAALHGLKPFVPSDGYLDDLLAAAGGRANMAHRMTHAAITVALEAANARAGGRRWWHKRWPQGEFDAFVEGEFSTAWQALEATS